MKKLMFIPLIILFAAMFVQAADVYKNNPYIGKPDNIGTFVLYSAELIGGNKAFKSYTSIDRVTAARLSEYSAHTQGQLNGKVAKSAFTNNSTYTAAHIRSLIPGHPAAGSDKNVQVNVKGVQSGAGYLNYSSPNTYIKDGKLIFPISTGTDRGISMRNAAVTDNSPSIAFYSESAGANAGASLQLIPKGTGFSAAVKSQVSIFNTDFVADSTNYDALVLRAAGTAYTLNATRGGTGSARPINFQMLNQTKATLNTDGRFGVGTTTPRAPFDNASSLTGKGKAYVGSATNYAILSQDQGLRFAGTALQTNDIQFNLAPGVIGSGHPAMTTFTTPIEAYMWTFTGSVGDHSNFAGQELPHWFYSPDGLTLGEFHLHWMTGTALWPVGSHIRWQLDISCAPPTSSPPHVQFKSVHTFYANYSAGSSVAKRSHIYSSFGNYTATACAIMGSQVIGRLQRVKPLYGADPATDPFTGQLGLHAYQNSIGSDQQGTKTATQ